MKTINQFSRAMSKRTDQELIQMITVDRETYQSEAIEAAEHELESRNIVPNQVDQQKSEIIQKRGREEKADAGLAGNWLRLANFMIDSLAWLIVYFVLATVITFIIDFFYPIQDSALFQFFIIIMLISTYIGYYAIMEAHTQKTLGKYITKTKVVTFDGQKPGRSVIMTRTFCRLIPFDRISFLFTEGFHDQLSKTKVIQDK